MQLSILVHPDKNQDDVDRAQKSFEGKYLPAFAQMQAFFKFVIFLSSCGFKKIVNLREENVLCLKMYCVLAVDKAYKLLLDPEQKKRALDVIHAGKEYVEHMVSFRG